ncbi:3-ketoacyl-ACP reductase [Enemella evansiae]|uniref:SDR family oxidoreductase n=1 Tax=Enemella evansiae TaxID=2016499 RepID=UPI000B961046|nr:SDR family oxidoreductase [Enemella evansiae]OYO05079.1 3-ketoacyl-ACP reductase [Enemella evansiae]
MGALQGRTALVTGVSRRKGIGYAVARGLAAEGAHLVIAHHRAHDVDQPWGADDLDAVRSGIRRAQVEGAAFADIAADLADPEAPARLISEAAAVTGSLDILVANQARSGGDGSILDMTADRLDGHWAVNARATILLTAEFARLAADPGDAAARPGDRRRGSIDEHAARRVFWMTSGQHDGPMPGEVAYAASKAALAGLTATVAAELLPLGVILNTINPGPVDTGYLEAEGADRDPEVIAEALAAMPMGRFGAPDDPARLIAWLAGDAGRWIVGQVLTSDGGFALR